MLFESYTTTFTLYTLKFISNCIHVIFFFCSAFYLLFYSKWKKFLQKCCLCIYETYEYFEKFVYKTVLPSVRYVYIIDDEPTGKISFSYRSFYVTLCQHVEFDDSYEKEFVQHEANERSVNNFITLTKSRCIIARGEKQKLQSQHYFFSLGRHMKSHFFTIVVGGGRQSCRAMHENLQSFVTGTNIYFRKNFFFFRSPNSFHIQF